ncbi:hypothetical protein GCM10027341_56260 [Spirosoma knui]
MNRSHTVAGYNMGQPTGFYNLNALIMNKKAYIQCIADWARSHGFVEIKANADGYEKPITYDRQQDGLSFTPDVTGKQFNQKSYFELVIKTVMS